MKLSNDFSLVEFDCHSGDAPPSVYFPNLVKLVTAVLQPLREQWGGPLIVVSGYRTREYNAKVGGAAESTHVTCEGCDIRPLHLRDVAGLHDMILQGHAAGSLPVLGGLGSYLRWVHVDTRRVPGRLRRWKGKGVGSEPGY